MRYYGLYSNHGKIPEEYLSKEQEGQNEIPEEELQKGNPLYCDYCKQEKVFIVTVFDKRTRTERKKEFQIIINNELKTKRKDVA